MLIEQGDHRVRGVGVELNRVGAFQVENIAGELNRCNLHSKAQPKIRYVVFPGILRGKDFALRAALTKAARHEDATVTLEHLGRPVFLDVFRLDALDLHAAVVGHAAVDHCLVDRFVGVLQLDVLAHHTDAHSVSRRDEFADDLPPLGHVGRRSVECQLATDQVVETLALQHERHLVDRMLHVDLLDHRLVLDVAEQRKLLPQFLVQRLLAAADEHVRRDADLTQFGHSLLGRLCFKFTGGFDVRDECDVQEQHIALPCVERKFPDRLDERQPLDVADRSTDLGDHHVGVALFPNLADPVLDFVRDMGNDLHRFTEVIAAPFLVQHPLVHLSAGKVVEARQLGAGKSLVMAEVKVGLRPVVEHVHLAVLKRAHRTGIDV